MEDSYAETAFYNCANFHASFSMTSSNPQQAANVSAVSDIQMSAEKLTKMINSCRLERVSANWYVLSCRWIETVGNATQKSLEHPKNFPIDNSDLLVKDVQDGNEQFHLRTDLIEMRDFALVDESVWSEFLNVFSLEDASHCICRKSVMDSAKNKIVVDLYPLRIYLRYVGSLGDVSAAEDAKTSVVFSRHTRFDEFKKKVCLDHGLPLYFVSFKKTNGPLCDEPAKTLEELGIKSGDVLLYSTNSDSFHSPSSHHALERMDVSGNKRSSFSSEEHEIGAEIEHSSSSPLSADSPDSNLLIEESPEEEETQILPQLTNFYQSSEESLCMYKTSDGRLLASKDAGLRGLVNLGNTCFMNAALQCLSHCTSLTEYFLSKRYRSELNITNPLGMKGRLAEAYAKVLFQLWNGENTPVAPYELKYIMSNFNSMFSGFLQHDSQEFLGFLLDGLHEDLNRIIRKPYTESVDAEGKSDTETSLESWKVYKTRNDSVIVDKFHGQCKSTLICPECEFVSVTFDPLAYIALPLPSINKRNINVCFVAAQQEKDRLVLRHETHQFDKISDVSDIFESVTEMYALGSSTELLAIEILPYSGTKMSDDSLENVNAVSFPTMRVLSDYFALSIIKPSSLVVCFEEPSQKMEATKSHSAFDQIIVCIKSDQVCIFPFLVSFPTHSLITKADLAAKIIERFPSVQKQSAAAENVELIKDVFVFSGSSGSSTYAFEPSVAQNSCRLMKEKEYSANNLILYIKLADFDSVDESLDLEAQFAAVSSTLLGSNGDAPAPSLTLYDCLDLYVKPEKLGENDLWFCPKCKKHQQAIKKFDIWQASEYLVVFLKRFSTGSRWGGGKITSLVSYPVLDLDLSRYILGPNAASFRYDLVGVTLHSGSLGFGHYTAYAHNAADDNWYLFNDSCVTTACSSTSASLNRLVTADAYVLIYKKTE